VTDVTYRQFDFGRDDVESLFALAARVFGDAGAYRARWQWEYEANPLRERYLVLVAEHGGTLVGATSRLPARLRVGDRVVDGAFNANSMVDAAFRGRGIMRELYRMSGELIPVLISKGTLPGMRRLLPDLGYVAITPDTFMKAVLSPVRWLLMKARVSGPSGSLLDYEAGDGPGFEPVRAFAAELDDALGRMNAGALAVLKDATWMQWRYVANPVRAYRIFCRRTAGRITAVIVLSGRGSAARIVDVVWDRAVDGEAARTIRFAKRYLRRCGFVTVMCWATLHELRAALRTEGFFAREDALPLHLYSHTMQDALVAAGAAAHFVDGDGDSEYLP
jgi:GNAT superfamily N-acetyltransferase